MVLWIREILLCLHISYMWTYPHLVGVIQVSIVVYLSPCLIWGPILKLFLNFSVFSHRKCFGRYDFGICFLVLALFFSFFNTIFDLQPFIFDLLGKL